MKDAHTARGSEPAYESVVTAALLDSMSADELADELAERVRDGYDEDGLWGTLRQLAGKANGLTNG